MATFTFAAALTLLMLFQAEGATKPAPTPAATATAPAAAPESLNLTEILEKGSQFTTFLRLLKDTQIGEQIDNQLNNTYGGMTILAPTDNAFNSLKAGTLNSLNPQEQAALILYHVLPRYYSLMTFQTSSNPITTQATGNHGAYVVNITSTANNQVNVSTGVNQTPLSTSLRSTFPLAVYQIDSVLLPYDLFGPKPPAAAPKPSEKPKVKAKAPSAESAETSEDSTVKGDASRRNLRWTSVAGMGLMSICVMMMS